MKIKESKNVIIILDSRSESYYQQANIEKETRYVVLLHIKEHLIQRI